MTHGIRFPAPRSLIREIVEALIHKHLIRPAGSSPCEPGDTGRASLPPLGARPDLSTADSVTVWQITQTRRLDDVAREGQRP